MIPEIILLNLLFRYTKMIQEYLRLIINVKNHFGVFCTNHDLLSH